MKCDRCGHELSLTDRQCAVCGAGAHTTELRAGLSPAASGDPDLTGFESSAAPADPDVTRFASGPAPPDPDLTLASELPRHPVAAGDTRPGGSAPLTRAQGPSGDTGPLSPGQNFGNRYHIVRLLGLGGMGAVYQAWDQELGVIAALKVTRPEIAADPKAAELVERRFKQELLLARKVTHKNVVRIHDIGEVNGIKYITMPFIEGEDLASVIARDGTLPFARVLHIARSLVSGLAAAHAVGVIHRDLKPANIMIGEDGDALITDFGIARSSGGPPPAVPPAGFTGQGASLPARPDHTVLGAVVGTIGYMAPEQATAKPVDHRADIYAVGLILYDMLGGRVRFERAEGAIAELTSRTIAAPPSVRAANSEVPESIDRIITRCLQPDPAARYQTAAELAADLDRLDDTGKVRRGPRHLTGRLAASVGTVFLALIVLTWWTSRTAAPVAEPSPVSLLIADFENRTGEAVFSGAIEQALGITMEAAPFISAYSRPKAHQIAEQLRPGATLDDAMAELVARREGLTVVLAGTIEKKGTRYAITARALDTSQPSGTPPVLASSSAVAADRDDVLPTIARLSSDLRRRLGDSTVTRDDSRPSETFTAASLDAMRAYVRGQDLQVAGQFQQALAAYHEAVQIDQGFGRAYAGMGVIYGNLKQPAKAEESYQKAMKHLDRMTEREKYGTLGGYYLLVSHDYDQAVENYQALVSRYPADRGGHANLAYAYLNKRQMANAVGEVRKSLDLEPGNMLQRMNYAMYSLYAGDFPTAIAESRKIPAGSGLVPYALLTEGRAAAASGDLTAAAATYARLAAAGAEGAAMARLARADLAMYQGRFAAALDAVRPAAVAAGTGGSPDDEAVTSIMAAEAHNAMGRRREASAAAGKAAQLSRRDDVLLAAALVFIDTGETARAESIAADLDNRLQAQSRAYAKAIAGALALRAKRLPAALDALRDSRQRVDSWLVHLMMGRTYLEAGQAPEALAEFETCVKRQGEATDLFFTDSATLRYLAPVDYWLGRTHQALGNPAARLHYDIYVRLRGATDAPDALLKDARARLAEIK